MTQDSDSFSLEEITRGKEKSWKPASSSSFASRLNFVPVCPHLLLAAGLVGSRADSVAEVALRVLLPVNVYGRALVEGGIAGPAG